MQIADNRLSSVRKYFYSRLSGVYQQGALNELFALLCAHYLSFSKARLISEPDHRLTESEMLHFVNATKRLLLHEPIQYIIEKAEFCDLTIKVNASALIPRPETEELTKHILSQHREKSLRVIDLCTGSGCIALALKHARPDWTISAIDISEQALKLAKENAELLNLDVEFICDDILNRKQLQSFEEFDIIVSNPPYVRKSEAAEISPEVLNHEPHLALFVDDNDALLFYREIVLFARKHLKSGGQLFFELNEFKAEDTLALFETFQEFNAKLLKDFYGKARFIEANKRNS
jgi:release factor glutamine methyltransferase